MGATVTQVVPHAATFVSALTLASPATAACTAVDDAFHTRPAGTSPDAPRSVKEPAEASTVSVSTWPSVALALPVRSTWTVAPLPPLAVVMTSTLGPGWTTTGRTLGTSVGFGAGSVSDARLMVPSVSVMPKPDVPS